MNNHGHESCEHSTYREIMQKIRAQSTWVRDVSAQHRPRTINPKGARR